MLPEVKPSAAEFGVTKGLDFLPDGIPIRGVAGDQQAALFGQGCFGPGEGKCTYGTGAFFLLHTGDTAVASKHKLLTTVAATTDATPKYALEGAVFIAGAAVQWLRDGLHLFKSSAEVERLARESNPAEPVLFVPGFVGLGAPHWVPEARGVIFGLTRATTAADLGRAALEGVAFQVADLIDAAEKDMGVPPAAGRASAVALKVDGGMSANDWFLQFQADVLGRPVARAAQAESTALGARVPRGGRRETDGREEAGRARRQRRDSSRRCPRRPRQETRGVAQGREGGGGVLRRVMPPLQLPLHHHHRDTPRRPHEWRGRDT